jgi:hypothetical protein
VKHWWLAPAMQIPMWFRLATRSNWTLRFPRAWRGRRVTVAISGEVIADEMAAIRRDRFELKSTPYEHSLMAFYFKDEGVQWVMGWKGKQVDAFKVTVALRATA